MNPRKEIPPATLVGARQLGQVEYIRQRLFTGRPENKTGMGSRAFQQQADGLGHRTVIALAVQRRQRRKGAADRRQVGREGFRNPKGMEPLELVAILQQLFIPDGKERPVQGRKHRQFVIGPLDRQERGAHGLDLFPGVKRSSAHQQVRDPARLERLDVRPGDIPGEKTFEPAEQQTHVARRNGHASGRLLALGHRPPALLEQPGDERAHRIRKRVIDGFEGNPFGLAVGARDRKGDDRRLISRLAAMRRQRHISSLKRFGISLHQRSERRVDGALYRRHGAEARGQIDTLRTARRAAAL